VILITFCARTFVTLLSGADITDSQFCTVSNSLPNLSFPFHFGKKKRVLGVEFVSYGGQGRM